MKIRIAAAAALAGSLLFIPIALENANAAHVGGGGSMGGGHFGGGGIGHFGGANIGRFDGSRIGRMGRARFADVGGMGAGRWNGGANWNGNWHRGSVSTHANNWNGNWHGNDHFDHNHHRFDNRFFGIGWWPAYYGYNYGYGGCTWLRRQAIVTGSPYWWNRYYSCANYY